MDHRRAAHARAYPAVKLGIAQYATFALLVVVLLALPGADRSHAGVALGCATFAALYAVMLALLPAKRSLLPLFAVGSGVYIADACVAIAATGGAHSPVRVLLIFSVVFAAFFYAPRPAVAILLAATLANGLPMAYDPRAFSAEALGLTIILDAVLIVTGSLMIAGRTELMRLRDAARTEAMRDPLTGLPNRRALMRFLEKRVGGERAGDRVGLIFLDLDAFKEINTLHGHAAGDAALKAAAEAIRGNARDGDMVARIGGDEFALIAPGIDAGALAELGARVVAAVGDADVALGASGGTAIAPDDAQTIDGLLEAADRALRRAKAAGKGRVAAAAR